MAQIELTDTQEQVLEYIKSFSNKHGYPPTRIEICECFLWSSPNAAQCHLNALAKKGAIKLSRGASRGIKCLI